MYPLTGPDYWIELFSLFGQVQTASVKRLVFSSAWDKTIDMNKKYIQYNNKHMQYKKQVYNTITENIHDTTKTTNNNTTVKN